MQEYAHRQGGIVSRTPALQCYLSHYVSLPAPLAKLNLVVVGMYKYRSVHTCQGLANQHGKASMYPTRAAILLVSFSGRANSGLCPATLDIRLRCGRTTPSSVQVVKTCMSHAAHRALIFAIQCRTPPKSCFPRCLIYLNPIRVLLPLRMR